MFFYNIAKNDNISYVLFELNYEYYFCIHYKKDVDLRLKSKIIKELSSKLQKFITICQQNFYYT